jgi:hypothetical protein
VLRGDGEERSVGQQINIPEGDGAAADAAEGAAAAAAEGAAVNWSASVAAGRQTVP